LNSIPPSLSLSSWLRAETRREHDEAERTLDLSHFLATRASYLDLLQRMFVALLPLEEQIAQLQVWERLGLGKRSSPRAERLVADLRFFGVAPRDVPLPASVSLDGFDEGVGATYVVEGSRLGGKIIAREAARTLGLSDGGLTFFSSDSAAVDWATFRRAIDAQVGVPPVAALRGARAAFDHIGACLRREVTLV
jgi:heme oxygenase